MISFATYTLSFVSVFRLLVLAIYLFIEDLLSIWKNSKVLTYNLLRLFDRRILQGLLLHSPTVILQHGQQNISVSGYFVAST
ncbi:hypothetical protein L228DRAFT_57945 [Xylona heveae TC161]|uniref:Uncharacterized protein n=1 Tax=Xylona heveae (strain CBS 132557 / TC161) TaxID=1328760 RepID=A0A165IH89_XYLHT|nr:hypothetical protein L228DRAFT_57945 [Xylona heveae TC161]KZF24894.1 hypothetical protein L228DRAFT_57945 [Xylona heveae TC161]